MHFFYLNPFSITKIEKGYLHRNDKSNVVETTLKSRHLWLEKTECGAKSGQMFWGHYSSNSEQTFVTISIG